MGIGVAIEEHRIKKGLSKRELASMLNVTYQDVSKWENDEVEPTYEWLVKISKALECSVDDLFEFRPVGEESPVEKRRKHDVKKRRINSFVFPSKYLPASRKKLLPFSRLPPCTAKGLATFTHSFASRQFSLE